jgi:hypothetical protein
VIGHYCSSAGFVIGRYCSSAGFVIGRYRTESTRKYIRCELLLLFYSSVIVSK